MDDLGLKESVPSSARNPLCRISPRSLRREGPASSGSSTNSSVQLEKLVVRLVEMERFGLPNTHEAFSDRSAPFFAIYRGRLTDCRVLESPT